MSSRWISRFMCSSDFVHRSRGLVVRAAMLVLALGLSCASPSESEAPADRESLRSPYAPADPDDGESVTRSALRREAAAARGRDLYVDACATCHGLIGDGNGRSAAPIDPPPTDFTMGPVHAHGSELGQRRRHVRRRRFPQHHLRRTRNGHGRVAPAPVGSGALGPRRVFEDAVRRISEGPGVEETTNRS